MIEGKNFEKLTVDGLIDWMNEFHQNVGQGKSFIKTSINKFRKMPQHQQSIVLNKTKRYFKACSRMEVPLEFAPVKEIIDYPEDI